MSVCLPLTVSQTSVLRMETAGIHIKSPLKLDRHLGITLINQKGASNGVHAGTYAKELGHPAANRLGIRQAHDHHFAGNYVLYESYRGSPQDLRKMQRQIQVF